MVTHFRRGFMDLFNEERRWDDLLFLFMIKWMKI